MRTMLLSVAASLGLLMVPGVHGQQDFPMDVMEAGETPDQAAARKVKKINKGVDRYSAHDLPEHGLGIRAAEMQIAPERLAEAVSPRPEIPRDTPGDSGRDDPAERDDRDGRDHDDNDESSDGRDDDDKQHGNGKGKGGKHGGSP